MDIKLNIEGSWEFPAAETHEKYLLQLEALKRVGAELDEPNDWPQLLALLDIPCCEQPLSVPPWLFVEMGFDKGQKLLDWLIKSFDVRAIGIASRASGVISRQSELGEEPAMLFADLIIFQFVGPEGQRCCWAELEGFCRDEADWQHLDPEQLYRAIDDDVIKVVSEDHPNG